MAKNNTIESPNITLAECIRQLEIINNNIFSLKQGTEHLMEAVESGNLDQAKSVIKVFKMKDVFKNLSPQD